MEVYMLHSHTKVWVHLIWTTKDRIKSLHKDLRITLFKHLIKQAEEIGIAIEKLNVQPEHIHLLFTLPSNMLLQDVAKNLKGESSRWINENELTNDRFQWQRGYGAFSVSPSLVNVVKEYVANQDMHHQKQSFMYEYYTFLRKYGVNR